MRVTGLKISVSAIVIDVIEHCHTAGAFWVERQKTFVPIFVWLGSDPFRPVENHTQLSRWMCNHFAFHHQFRIDTGRSKFEQTIDSILSACGSCGQESQGS